MVNLPVFFTSVVASAAKSSMIFEHSDFFRPLFAAKVSAMPVFVMALTDTAFFFMTFITFMATLCSQGVCDASLRHGFGRHCFLLHDLHNLHGH